MSQTVAKEGALCQCFAETSSLTVDEKIKWQKLIIKKERKKHFIQTE